MEAVMTFIKLNNGVNIPSLGLGTSHPLHGIIPERPVGKGMKYFAHRVCYNKYTNNVRQRVLARKLVHNVTCAINAGYRLIDTSAAYGNENLIRAGIAISGVPREQLFLTTRVSNAQQYDGSVRDAFLMSLQNLGVDYVDLYMFHWPVPERFLETWKQMERLYKEGFIKALGVANCHQQHLERLLDVAAIMPVVNQIEVHPLMTQKPLISYCKALGIVVEAYTPIARYHQKVRENNILKRISKEYCKSIPQVVLRWHLQNGVIPIPRSSAPVRIKENFDIYDFNLTDQEVKEIDNINKNLRLRYDPDNCDFRKL